MFRALFVGFVGELKGVRELLTAWSELALPRAELVLVGGADAEGRALLREFAGVHRWVGQVPRSDVERFYAESDVFVFPSRVEGSALVTYEAMASGLPVITTRTSGSVVRDGLDGHIVPVRDSAALASSIAHLHAHPENVARWRQRAPPDRNALHVAPLSRARGSRVQRDPRSGGMTAALLEPRVEPAVRTVCVLCGGHAFEPFRRACPDRLHWVGGEFGIDRCTGCGLLLTTPRLEADELTRHYPVSYAPYAAPTGRRGPLQRLVKGLAQLPYRLRYGTPASAPPRPGARLLDIGCGSGAYLAQMAGMGWEVWGVEPSSVAAAGALAALDLPQERIVVASAEDAELPDDAFDLVTMSHVLEHLSDPSAVLARIHGALRPGGTLRIRIPNVRSLESRVFGRLWLGLELPRHLQHFDRGTATRLLEQNGFRVTRSSPSCRPAPCSGVRRTS